MLTEQRPKQRMVPRGGIRELRYFNDLAFPNFAKARTESHRLFHEIPKLRKGGPHVFPLRNLKLTPYYAIEFGEVGHNRTCHHTGISLPKIAFASVAEAIISCANE